MIDFDLSPSKRPEVIKNIKKERIKYLSPSLDKQSKENLGCLFVGTYAQETSKSAVGTACRGYRDKETGESISTDVAMYLSSLIPVERGFVWSLSDVVYGNPDKGRSPVSAFVKEVNKYDGLLDIMFGIENIISRRGIHASGVLLFDGNPYEKCAFMKAPNGEITTQYDLSDCEYMSGVKLDMLLTEVCEKITETLRIMQEQGVIEKELSIREAYNKYIHPDSIDLEDEDVWDTIKGVKSLSLFQFSTQVGGTGVRRLKPNSIQELSNVNALVRLAAEDGDEPPIDLYERFKNNPTIWEDEMTLYGLTEEEKESCRKILSPTYGVGISQEQLMLILMDDKICHFTLEESNKARKIVSKKKLTEIPPLREKIFSRARTPRVAEYVWHYVVKPQLSYAFSEPHSISYSLIAYQTAYLATKWNPIYWNTACLIVESGSLENGEEKGKTKGSNYDKIAKAIGNLQAHGVSVSLLDINDSDYGFKPDVKNNTILFGLKAADRIGDDIVEMIKQGRPYTGIKDFMKRCKISKLAMVSLIKGGAFDKIDNSWASKIDPENPRKAIMTYYLMETSSLKNKVTITNFNALKDYNLLPKEILNSDSVKIKNYTSFLKDKKNKRLSKSEFRITIDEYNSLSNILADEISKGIFDPELRGEDFFISQKHWEKIYKDKVEPLKEWISNNQDILLENMNVEILRENYNKYAAGSVSKWEMQSLCFYYHDHELKGVNRRDFGIDNYGDLPEEPFPEKFLVIKDKRVPIYHLSYICGTVIGKDKIRGSVTLLTEDGVVYAKMNKEYFANLDRQISAVDSNGVKKKLESSWFTRGNLLMIKGIRTGADQFRVKNYKRSEGHQVYLITNISKQGNLTLTHKRADEVEG